VTRRRGRPPDGEGPAVNWDEVEELLRRGERRRQPDGTDLHVRMSLREIARRVGVSHTLVGRFARRKGITPATTRGGRPPAPRRKRVAHRGRGRPKGGAGVDWDAVERRLLTGDVLRASNGREIYVIPSVDDLAEEVGVDPSLVRRFIRARQIRERRAEALAAVPARVTQDDAIGIVTGELQVGPYPEAVRRIANTYAAMYQQDLEAGEVRRGEASTLERLVRTDMAVQAAAVPTREDSIEVIARLIAERLPGIQAARARHIPGVTDGLVIELPESAAVPVVMPDPARTTPAEAP
jgi:AcrR family transcriptional regulator